MLRWWLKIKMLDRPAGERLKGEKNKIMVTRSKSGQSPTGWGRHLPLCYKSHWEE